jgi:hypothetical protein
LCHVCFADRLHTGLYAKGPIEVLRPLGSSHDRVEERRLGGHRAAADVTGCHAGPRSEWRGTVWCTAGIAVECLWL